MKVKILIFPLSVLVVLYMAIFLIQPEFKRYMAENSLLETRQSELADVEQKIRNSSLLSQNLDNNKQYEDFALRYLPMSQGDDRIVDSLNFLSSQSGLALTSVKLTPIKESTAVSEETRGSASANALFASAENTTGIQQAPQVSKPKLVKSEIVLIGSYEGIRDFVNKIAHSDQFNDFRLVTVEQKQSSTSGTDNNEESYNNILEASLTVEFSYLPAAKNVNQSGNAIFSQSAFNFNNIQKMQQAITSPVPALESGSVGKGNPFVR